jgi:predicted AlkP superfamily pyrophosphatase or phosphodiesterase
MVDQMRAEYLDVFRTHWEQGLRTLVREGAVFPNAAYPYANTVTCAGHATVATGTFPHTHGIIGNSWWDRDRGVAVDCNADVDARAAHVSYGAPVKSGNGPHLMTADTLGDLLRRRSPASRVVSLSLKPDAAIPMAGHGGDLVIWFDGDAGAFVTSRAFASATSPELTAFFAANPLDAEFSSSWTLLKRPESYLNPDASAGQMPPPGRDGLFPHEIGGTGSRLQSAALWEQSPLSDRYLARMAVAMIDALKLGADDAPDLLAVGFSALDIVGHAFGPGSREVEDVLVSLDASLGQLVAALDRRVGRGRYVLGLTSDHGVGPVAVPPNGRLMVDDMDARLEALLRSHLGNPTAKDGYVVVRAPYVYLAQDDANRVQSDTKLQQRMLQTIAGVPGVLKAIPADQLSATSSDPLVRAAALSYVKGRSGDIVFVPRPGWIPSGKVTTIAATHGSPHEYDRRVPLILLGGSVRPGRYERGATPADIAPTLGYVAGVALPRAEGRVLREALR